MGIVKNRASTENYRSVKAVHEQLQPQEDTLVRVKGQSSTQGQTNPPICLVFPRRFVIYSLKNSVFGQMCFFFQLFLGASHSSNLPENCKSSDRQSYCPFRHIYSGIPKNLGKAEQLVLAYTVQITISQQRLKKFKQQGKLCNSLTHPITD